MFYKATKAQTVSLLNRKGSICTFLLLLAMILYNFISNVNTFEGRDICEMYQPMKLLLLSYNRVSFNGDMTLLFVQLYPILVVCPAGFILSKEFQFGESVFMTARLGQKKYLLSKLLSSFLTTFIVFTVPFLIEIVLNCISFPLDAVGDLSNWHLYSEAYIKGVHSYLFYQLYLLSPYFYAVVGTVFFGVVSGILSMFTVAISSIVKAKYNVFLLLPVFLLLHISVMIAEVNQKAPITTRWYDYVLLFNDCTKSPLGFVLVIFIIILSSFVLIHISSRRDCLR